MALSYVGAASYVATSGALPTFAAGDLALVFAYRDGNQTAPSVPSGWVDYASGGANSNSARVGYRVLQSGDLSTGTWTNATEIEVIVLRGQHATTPLGLNAAQGTDTSNQIFYPAFALTVTDGTSWVVGFAGHRTATDVHTQAVSGMTTRSQSATTSLGMHTAQGVSSFSQSNYTATVNASAAWRSWVLEVRAAVTEKVTGTARISLQAGNAPASRTNHILTVRGRVSAANGEVFRAQLYEGATARSAVLQSPALTTGLVTNQFAIADSDAAAITSYADLEVRVWGVSPGGLSATFTIAQVSLSIPAGVTNVQYGASIVPLALGLTTLGSISGTGTTQTGTAVISLTSGFTPGAATYGSGDYGEGAYGEGGTEPVVRTGHVIHVRARKTNGAHTGVIRVQLYEGTTARTPVLETSALTTSLADYALAIAEADAATIVSYADLEVRLWGFSSTGTSTVFEVAEVALALPGAGTGGDITGAVAIPSVASLFVDTAVGGTVYPGTNVFPTNLVHIVAVTDISVTSSGARVLRGVVDKAFAVTLITSADVPTSERTGAVVISAVTSVTATGTYTRLAQCTITATTSVTAGSSQESVGTVTIASTATVTVSGVVPAAPLPPNFIDTGFADMPDLLVAVAFATSPLASLQTFTGVSNYVRNITSRRGRQFELDRVEAGQSGFLLGNLDGRFSPENSSGPYYPNVIPNRQVKWRLFWDGLEYAVFAGYLEGYPQEWPDFVDNVVKQRAIDGFMVLARAKLLPGSTSLTSTLLALTAQQTEIIDVESTALPMPQAVPFDIKIEDEELTVEAIVSGTQYSVIRQADVPGHSPLTPVTTTAVSFGRAYSGTRVAQLLERVGVTAYDVAAGQSELAPSEDIAGTSPLEHLLQVAEWEQGRFFAARDGTLTFHDRHWTFRNEQAARATFGDGVGELPYADVRVTHEHERIYNIVRITPASGNVQEARDQSSIDDHFESPLEKSWPLVDDNEALSAAQYLLLRYARMQVRVPELTLRPRGDTALYPHVLAMEMGQRFRLVRRPANDAELDKQLIVEGVAQDMVPDNLVTRVQFSLADTTPYWQLGVAGKSELDSTARLIY